jgi:putative spermidine/putrescine transport system ATP-binding protein
MGMTAPEPTLVLDRLTKRYRGAAAVDDVTLAIEGGSFFSLLGPSGSGKTTLLMLVAGFVEPDSGTIALGKRDITAMAPEKRNFGMVFQGYALFPNLTAAENIAFPLKVRRMSRTEQRRRVAQALDLVRLNGFQDRMPRQLSGGQQQRVALARALVFEPDILLLDEPLSALDKKLRTGLQAELRELQRRIGKTFLCVTHDQDEALSMSDEIAVIRDGRVVQRGTPLELFERPATHFVADFLGESNFLEGQRVGHGDFTIDYVIGDTALVQAADGRAVGDRILIALRPSKIRLDDAAPADGNKLPGTLRHWSYRGSEIQCCVDTPVGPLWVTQTTWQSSFVPSPGRPVWLSWSNDAAVLVEDDR